MFVSKSTIFFSFLALCNFVAAETPGCLLSSVGTQPDPSDLATICGTNAAKVETKITSNCGDNAQVALNAFSSICSSAGHKLAVTSSKSESNSNSGTASASSSGSASTGFVTATTKTSSSTATGTSSSETGSSSSTTTSSNSTSSGSALASGAASASEVGSAASFAAAVFLGFAAML